MCLHYSFRKMPTVISKKKTSIERLKYQYIFPFLKKRDVS